MADYDHRSLADFDPHPQKPGRRWAVSKELGLEEYNLNVGVLEEGDPLSQTHFHAHESQDECYYVLEGRCQLEVGDESVTVEADDVVRVPRGVPHLVHNPHYDEPCKLIAIGSPPEGRYPVTMYDSYEHVLADRYDGDDGDDGGQAQP